MLPSCEGAQVRVAQQSDGQWWEVFTVGDQVFSNAIAAPDAYTRTPAPEVMASRGLCAPAQAIAAVVGGEESSPPLPGPGPGPGLSPGIGAIVLGGIVLGLLGIIGLGVLLSYAIKPDPTIPLPQPPPRLLPPPLPSPGIDDPMVWDRVNTTPPPPPPRGGEFTGNSPEFTGNSPANSPRIHLEFTGNSPANSPYDPTAPVQPGEYEAFILAVERGMNPRGNEIIAHIWGARPGKAAAYQAARDRREQFADQMLTQPLPKVSSHV